VREYLPQHSPLVVARQAKSKGPLVWPLRTFYAATNHKTDSCGPLETSHMGTRGDALLMGELRGMWEVLRLPL
jgi:hypothetical protein